MLRLEPRAQPSAWMAWLSPVLAVLMTAFCVVILVSVVGKDPVASMGVFFYAPIKDLRGWSEVGVKVAPLLLIAVGLSMCFRANVFNIGAEGQLVVGAIAAGATVLHLDDGSNGGPVLIALALVVGALGGMAWAAIVAFLKDRFNANEVLVSLMLVYVAELLLSWLVHGPLIDPDGFGFPQSRLFSDGFLLPSVLSGTRLHIGIVLAFVASLLGWAYLSRSFSGFKLRVGGMAPLAARYAGFSSRRTLWTAMLISGGLAGVAGAAEVMGPIGQLAPSISPGYGFAAIIVAFVGRLQPVGGVFRSFHLGRFLTGGELSQTRLGMPSAITGIFQGILLFALLACDVMIHNRLRWRK